MSKKAFGLGCLLGAVAGGFAAFVFDPVNGRERRMKVRDHALRHASQLRERLSAKGEEAKEAVEAAIEVPVH